MEVGRYLEFQKIILDSKANRSSAFVDQQRRLNFNLLCSHDFQTNLESVMKLPSILKLSFGASGFDCLANFCKVLCINKQARIKSCVERKIEMDYYVVGKEENLF